MDLEQNKDTAEIELVKKRLPLNMTVAEWEALKALAEEEDTELINVVRRALRDRFRAKGKPLPGALFADRKPGNRLPKSDRQPVIKVLAV